MQASMYEAAPEQSDVHQNISVTYYEPPMEKTIDTVADSKKSLHKVATPIPRRELSGMP
jgi:hypothetical protein